MHAPKLREAAGNGGMHLMHLMHLRHLQHLLQRAQLKQLGVEASFAVMREETSNRDQTVRGHGRKGSGVWR